MEIFYVKIAIARFLAKQYNLAGKNASKQAKIDSIIDFKNNFVTQLTRLMHKTVPFLENLAKNLENHKFLLSSGLTYADFGLVVVFETLQKLYSSLMKPYIFCKRHCKSVYSLPKLQRYLKVQSDTLS